MLYYINVIIITIIYVAEYEKKFFEYIQENGLKFPNGNEFVKRLEIFVANSEMIREHNANPKSTFKMAVNRFTHLTADEFKQYYNLGIKKPNLRVNAEFTHAPPADMSSVPTSADWSAAGAVTPVKNQGQCGSCWTFSTTGALEGAYYLKTKNLVSFSEQQLVSCDTQGQDQGCNGGWMDDAFTYVKSNGGLPTEQDYPYTSGTGITGACVKGKTMVAGVAPKSYTDVTPNSVSALADAVSKQPVSIAIEADQSSFQFYSSGVLTSGCGQQLDHGVLVTGYGTLNGVDYWTVKNSWGSSWGENGYILIEKSSANLCGVLSAPSYPNL